MLKIVESCICYLKNKNKQKGKEKKKWERNIEW